VSLTIKGSLMTLGMLVLGSSCAMGPKVLPRYRAVPSKQPVHLTVTSTPPGAHVLINRYSAKREHEAEFLGTTPLTRFYNMRKAGEQLIVSKRAYRTYRGEIDGGAENVHVDLEPLTERELKRYRWWPLLKTDRITVVPLGLKTHSIHDLDASEREAYEQRFFPLIHGSVTNALSRLESPLQVMSAAPPFQGEALWKGLWLSSKKYRPDKVLHYPLPPRVKCPADLQKVLSGVKSGYALIVWYDVGMGENTVWSNPHVRRAVQSAVGLATEMATLSLLGGSVSDAQGVAVHWHQRMGNGQQPYFFVYPNFLRISGMLIESKSHRMHWKETVYLPMKKHSAEHAQGLADIFAQWMYTDCQDLFR